MMTKMPKTKKNKVHITSIRFDDDDYSRYLKIAQRHGLTMSDLIRLSMKYCFPDPNKQGWDSEAT